MSAPVVRPATLTDRERILDTVLAAFVADPAFRYFFPTDGSYAEEAPLFVGDLMDQRLSHQTVWLVDDESGDVMSVAMWNPPEATQHPLPDGLSAGTKARIDRFDAAVRALIPREPHWYLGILATHPAHAGRGLGRLAMAPALDRAVAAGCPCVLETVTAVNVGIYQRYGWQVTGETDVAGVHVWVLQRRP